MKNGQKIRLLFGLVWKLRPAYFFWMLFSTVASAGQVICNVIFPRYLIDELTGKMNPQVLAGWVAMVAGSNLLFTFLKRAAKRRTDVMNLEVRLLIEGEFTRKVMSLEYSCLEDPYYLDLKERAVFANENQGAVSQLIDLAVTAVTQLVTLVSLAAIMVQLGWGLVALLAVTIVLMLVIRAGFSAVYQKVTRELIPVNRKYGYYLNLAAGLGAQKDIRLYSMQKMLGDRVTKFNGELNDWLREIYYKQGTSMGLYQLITILQTVLAYGYVGSKAINGKVTIGGLTMYASAGINFASAIMGFGGTVIQIIQVLSFLDPFVELMAMPDAEEEGRIPFEGEIETIEFSHVTFSYPKTESKVLEDVSFTIEKGQHISVVGRNGAGKSTIVKLICRLYRPDSGIIYINGRNVFEYELKSYLAAVAAVFQDFKLFNVTIEENISCERAAEGEAVGEKGGKSGVSSGDAAGTKNCSHQSDRVSQILSDVGMTEKMESLPHGIHTLFGKAYDKDAVEFSGGQAQKIAIARALYKDASLVILDEPTSALDPIAEAEIYENFHTLVGDKTAVYISHRMSSSVFCDKVMVINHGKVEAFDSHENLMKDTEGLYYQLFTAQAENYTEMA